MFQLMKGESGCWIRIRDGIDIIAVTTALRPTVEEAIHDAIRLADIVEDNSIETDEFVTVTYYETENIEGGGKSITVKRKTERK